MYAHSCQDAPVALSAARLGPLPCVVVKSSTYLHGGQALTWSYDGRRDSQGSSYAIDQRSYNELMAMVPCARRPCPRSRWLRDFARP